MFQGINCLENNRNQQFNGPQTSKTLVILKFSNLSANTNLSKEDSTSIMQWEPTVVFL